MAGQIWVTDTVGGFLGNVKLSKQLRFAAQPLQKFRQFCQVKGALGKNRNDTLVFDKVRNIETEGGTLVETDTIPESEFTIGQGTLTITEYGNSIPFSGKLDALAEFDVDNAVTVSLRNDMAKVLDKACATQFLLAEEKYLAVATTSFVVETVTTGLPTNMTETATTDLNEFHVRNIVSILEINNVPRYDGKDYICIGSILALKSLTDAPDWVNANLYGDPEKLFSGEVGRFYGVRFIKENHILSNTMGTDANRGEAIFFGADACMEGMAIAEELRAKVPTDFGRSQAVAWYALLGYRKIWDLGNDAEPHIVHFNPQ